MSARSVKLAASAASVLFTIALLPGCPGDPGDGDGSTGMDAGSSDVPYIPGTDVPIPRPDTPGVCTPTIEICGDRMDQDCNGRDTSCGDGDRDGVEACRAGDDLRTCDCDDANAAAYPASGGGAVPGGDEVCDGVDNDCNFRVDEAAECCSGCAAFGTRGDVCTEAGNCDCSTEPGDGVCAEGQTCCRVGCVDLRTDINNCGLCNAMCTNQADHCEDTNGDGVGECRCGDAPPCDKAVMCGGGSC